MVTTHWGERWLNPALAWLLRPWAWFYKRLERAYVRSVKWVARAPWAFLGIATGLTVLGFAYFPSRVEMDFVPEIDQGDVTIRLEYPADCNLRRCIARTTAIARRLLADETAVTHTNINCGKVQGQMGTVSEGPYLAEVNLRLTPMTERPDDPIGAIRARLRARLADEPDCIYSVLIPSAAGGASQDIAQYVKGPDLDVLDQAGLRMAKAFAADPVNTDVASSIRPASATSRSTARPNSPRSTSPAPTASPPPSAPSPSSARASNPPSSTATTSPAPSSSTPTPPAATAWAPPSPTRPRTSVRTSRPAAPPPSAAWPRR